MTEDRVYLVSCVAQKAAHATAARDLYQSAWFRKARSFVDGEKAPWFILSAKYGLVAPDERIAPYEVTLNRMPADERRRWAERVLGQLLPRLTPGSRIAFLAGRRYRDHLASPLRERGFEVEVPMEGMRIGKQLQWLGRGSATPTHENPYRLRAVQRLYSILDDLRERIGYRTLGDSHGRMEWPARGLYFFFEHGEEKTTSGSGLRVTRIGTHAVSRGSKTTLWRRLAQHRGTEASGGGNHRGSVFRLLVGQALLKSSETECATWAVGNTAPADVRQGELELERRVSDRLRSMPFLFVAADDEPGPGSVRAYVERNAIGLLSNRTSVRDAIDPPRPGWLGRSCPVDAVRESGLWNSKHVSESPDPAFLDVLERLAGKTR